MNTSQELYAKGDFSVSELGSQYVNKDEIVLPPGKYWIGDPSYSAGADGDAWWKWVQLTADTDDPVLGAMYGEYPVIGVLTKYGDGAYLGSDNFNYFVDAGMIGAVPCELLERMQVPETEYANFGTFIDVPESDTLTVSTDSSIISFSTNTQGELTIDTDPEPEEMDDADLYVTAEEDYM